MVYAGLSAKRCFMEIITEVSQLNNKSFEKGCSVAIGKFETLHLGHMEIMSDIALYNPSVVISFDEYFDDRKKLISDKRRFEILSKAGIKTYISVKAFEDLYSYSAEDFIEKILVNKFHAGRVVCGNDFKFGKGRTGNVGLLKKYGSKYGFSVRVYDMIKVDGCVVSSSKIRELIGEGNMSLAVSMLGRPYEFEGIVNKGNKIGRTLDYPTVNLSVSADRLIPKYGVYSSTVTFFDNDTGDGCEYKGITNVGVKPTVTDERNITVETFIFDFSGVLYGKDLIVGLKDFVRPERKFESLKQLKDQITSDIQRIM